MRRSKPFSQKRAWVWPAMGARRLIPAVPAGVMRDPAPPCSPCFPLSPPTIAAPPRMLTCVLSPPVVSQLWRQAPRLKGTQRHTCACETGRVPGSGPEWKLSSSPKPSPAAAPLWTAEGSGPRPRAGAPSCSRHPPLSLLGRCWESLAGQGRGWLLKVTLSCRLTLWEPFAAAQAAVGRDGSPASPLAPSAVAA